MFWSLHFPSMGHMLELRQLQVLSLVGSDLLIRFVDLSFVVVDFSGRSVKPRPNNSTLQIYIALDYLLSTLIADEIFNSLYYIC